MSWYLEYTHPEDGPQRLLVEPGKSIRVGRGTASDTRIPDSTLSRVHCEISLQDNVPTLIDLGSSSGTFVGKERVHQHELKSDDQFQAGNTLFRLVLESSLDAPTNFGSDDNAGSDSSALAAQLQQQGKLDRFPLLELVNDGGRNLVFRSEDPETGRPRAVKILPTNGGSDEDEARFLRAMKMLQEIRDPSLVKLYRAGRKADYCWVAMEWFEEGSIVDRTASHGIGGRLDWKDTWRVAYSICKSLEVLEKHSIVHRNIRPTNILYRSQDDSWVLSDLVVAKAEDLGSQTAMVTQQVFLPSNLAYTAPERLFGREANEHSLQADIYSLGAVLTEMLTGEPPYGNGELKDILPRLRNAPKRVDPRAQLGMNETLVDFVNRMASPDPKDRFDSASELWSEVNRVGRLSGMAAVQMDDDELKLS